MSLENRQNISMSCSDDDSAAISSLQLFIEGRTDLFER